MAGRILNRQARTKILYNLLAIAGDCGSRNGLAGVMAVAQTALDAGEDVEKVRTACNDRLAVIRDAKKKGLTANELFTNKAG